MGDWMLLLLDVGLSFAVALYARRLYRRPVLWFFFALLFSPIICGPLLFLMGPRNPKGYNNYNRRRNSW
jgi:putative effector of murein hydrolase